ncbi:MAG: TIGR00730 family Rossman fold protein [Firmicutes bacterium]|nr:TIGR00730 family Rossman fold protein [Bacillota bacterium]
MGKKGDGENFDFFESGFMEYERGARIVNELAETKKRLEDEKIRNTIVMFGSARIKHDTTDERNKAYYDATFELANRLASWSKEKFKNRPEEDKYYICSGGGGGIMEAANRGASAAGEKSTGFTIKLPFEEKANAFIPKELVYDFHYFFIRKFYFAYLAKAFVIFPGGFGTLDELFEILTLSQTQKMQKTPPFVIFGKQFFEKIINFDMLLEHGFISKEDKELFILTDSVDEAFEHITKNIGANNFVE